jgi:Phosphomevalonate kinase
MILLGISGKKRSGKNTVASYVSLLTNQTTEEFAFAQDLKLELATLMKVKVSDIELNKELYRPLLQALGEFRRKNNGEDYWINKCFRRVLMSNAEVCIITDVRYLNEVKAIEQAGGIVVRVHRRTQSNDTHSSEVELDEAKFVYNIYNNFTLENLLTLTKDLCKQVGIKLK